MFITVTAEAEGVEKISTIIDTDNIFINSTGGFKLTDRMLDMSLLGGIGKSLKLLLKSVLREAGLKASGGGWMLHWYECDKAWIGVAGKYRKLIHMAVTDSLMDDHFPHVHSKPRLIDVMCFADSNGIPYKLSTVKPEVETCFKISP
jgi:hypothetical protein